MFKSGKKVFIGALTVGCLFGGSVLSNVTVANADTIQGNSQQMIGFQTGMDDQRLLNMWLQLGISNQQQSGEQPGQRVRQQFGQQPGQRVGQQSGEQPGQRVGQQPSQQLSPINIITQVASILNVEEQTITDELQAGNNLVEIAESYDVSEATLLTELEDLLGDAIDDAVTAGTITETQATEMKSQLTERLTQLVESTFNNSNSSLSAPTDLTATVESSSEIYLDWDSVSDATSYYIYRATSSSGTYSKIDTVKATSYTDTDLSDDTTYYYKVKAVNSSDTSAYSSIVHATTEEED
ncbi:fibronectin type III domain-containing protein [Desulfosporosinus orientis DSM 765]|uniref:Fibronectin type III domain-containing protein n=1 Tax=Desulfosporosinus orientis (strain ATCC 19365 / DSM 765 / NCIMB 8382 / VKM B-1628 / Singapore I) TaxID=768706 RepID=G7WGG6_DESOD|nr:fibronectin type III domain-containing protein [Desulfosporosinus orientis]AET68043.1 fibronectin type III domain-containing protein [Desulfosporosinus orientis DSM 765]